MQHRRYPEFFSASELHQRDALFREWARDSTLVVLSSRAALADLIEFLGPAVESKCRVLSFVSQPKAIESGLAPVERMMARHAIPRRYFLLPNQFWKHKNHAVVIEALALLRANDPEIVVVATGPQEDFRHPHHFAETMERVRTLGIGKSFRALGLVPFADLMALMKHSVAVINPSLFEGWSTTVEEAKSAGKALLLSDIAVHREQAPARADYFPPHDTAALAELMRLRWRGLDPREDEQDAARAATELPARTRAFAESYQRIVLEALEIHGRATARLR
jgi:glycosyltransferase involved in cell wall biosynthesis